MDYKRYRPCVKTGIYEVVHVRRGLPPKVLVNTGERGNRIDKEVRHTATHRGNGGETGEVEEVGQKTEDLTWDSIIVPRLAK